MPKVSARASNPGFPVSNFTESVSFLYLALHGAIKAVACDRLNLFSFYSECAPSYENDIAIFIAFKCEK